MYFEEYFEMLSDGRGYRAVWLNMCNRCMSQLLLRNVVRFQEMTTNPYNTGFGAGFIEAKVSQLRKLVCRLETRVDVMGLELDCLQEEVREIEAEVKLRVQMTKDERLGCKVADFMALLEKAQTLLRRYEQRANAFKEFEETFGQKTRVVDVMASEAVSSQRELSVEVDLYVSDNEERVPCRLMSKVNPTSTFVATKFQQATSSRSRAGSWAERDICETGGERQMLVSYGVQHRDTNEQSSRDEKGGKKEQSSRDEKGGRDERSCRVEQGSRGEHGDRGICEQDGREARGRIQEQGRTNNNNIHERSRREETERGREHCSSGAVEGRSAPRIGDEEVPGPSGSSIRKGRGSCRGGVSRGCGHRTTVASDQASQWLRPQERFSGPVWGRAYPPILKEPPIQLRRYDPKLIGMSEVYVRPRRTSPKMCPLCAYNQHKLYRCTRFLRMNLQERWYTVLMEGLCLNCLIHGHSHYTCSTPGACYRCGKRHNSQLCPQGPRNE